MKVPEFSSSRGTSDVLVYPLRLPFPPLGPRGGTLEWLAEIMNGGYPSRSPFSRYVDPSSSFKTEVSPRYDNLTALAVSTEQTVHCEEQ